MDPAEKFVLYLEKHPEYYVVTQSELYISFLEFLSQGNKTADDLHKHFEKVEFNDVHLILDSLVALKLVKKTEAGGIFVYSATPGALEFLEKYRETKKHFEGE